MTLKTDYGNWTLLHADATQGALQVFLRDPAGPSTENGERGHWINADPLPNSFVVNIGEMVEVYSAGLYKATLHRVIHKSPSYRVSIPFFYEPSFNARIEVSTSRPHAQSRHAEPHLRAASPICAQATREAGPSAFFGHQACHLRRLSAVKGLEQLLTR